MSIAKDRKVTSGLHSNDMVTASKHMFLYSKSLEAVKTMSLEGQRLGHKSLLRT